MPKTIISKKHDIHALKSYLDTREFILNGDIASAYELTQMKTLYFDTGDLNESFMSNDGDDTFAASENSNEIKQQEPSEEEKEIIKARNLGAKLALANFGFGCSKDDIKNVRNYEKGFERPAVLLDDYKNACDEYNNFGFFEWLVSFLPFVHNDCYKARQEKKALLDAIKKTKILDGRISKVDEDNIKTIENPTSFFSEYNGPTGLDKLKAKEQPLFEQFVKNVRDNEESIDDPDDNLGDDFFQNQQVSAIIKKLDQESSNSSNHEENKHNLNMDEEDSMIQYNTNEPRGLIEDNEKSKDNVDESFDF